MWLRNLGVYNIDIHTDRYIVIGQKGHRLGRVFFGFLEFSEYHISSLDLKYSGLACSIIPRSYDTSKYSLLTHRRNLREEL